MSANPFRHRSQQDQLSGSTTKFQVVPPQVSSDGNGARTAELSLDTKIPSSLDRHVSFASPPVDTTIPPASYPSSPESTRFSPPTQHSQPLTPDYRSAFQPDALRGVGRDGREDHAIQQALNNTHSNVTIGQFGNARPEENAVQDTLSRFASAPRLTPRAAESTTYQPSQASRQSLDVDAFARLLLTGDGGQNIPGTATPPIQQLGGQILYDSSSGTDSTSISQQSMFDTSIHAADLTPRSSHEHDRNPAEIGLEEWTRIPPPAPAPRRGKSVKVKSAAIAPEQESAQSAHPTENTTRVEERRKPPTPPLARRHSQRTPSAATEDSIEFHSDMGPQAELQRTNQRPPPPPMRRQHSVSQRRPSNDLAPTIEEPEPESIPIINSRRSSNDRPPPPPSRNSSISGATKRQSLGFMNPPPVPPPRKGRESSRSSMDGFRPSLSSIVGEGGGQENTNVTKESRHSNKREQRNVSPSNADSILAEIANLQKEVDAARRGA